MRENFLHEVWRLQKFKSSQLKTTCGKHIQVLHTGEYNLNSGPDFLNARLQIDEQDWAGNVELHIRSSHWYDHGHQNDKAYDNVILHVVWENNAMVFRTNGSPIICLQIKDLVDSRFRETFTMFFENKSKWINCESFIDEIDNTIWKDWLEQLYLERLHLKISEIEKHLQMTNGDWEATLFRMLARAFGSVLNGDSFLGMTTSFDFSLLRKLQTELRSLEALFYGQLNLLNEQCQDPYFRDLQHSYRFLNTKYELTNHGIVPLRFYKARPAGFPTIRLSQLAQLYHRHSNLFQMLMSSSKRSLFQEIFAVSASSYWNDHYRFGVLSKFRKKHTSIRFIDNLIINVVVPIQYRYNQSRKPHALNTALDFMRSLPFELNKFTRPFKRYQLPANNALDSQAIKQLKHGYCDKNKCLSCSVGRVILNRNM
ncbi:MAG: DUF2851 family protein [Flavobacteriaceae bacterium]|nr:DUF2851 family protein [Flavobacteriaceae bacterium]